MLVFEMRNEVKLESVMTKIDNTVREAWDTFGYYEQTLMSNNSGSEIYGERLASQIRGLYIQVAFALEALQLPSLLLEFKAGFERYRKKTTATSMTCLGDSYPSALVYIEDFIIPLRAAMERHSDPIDGLQQLERILLGTPKIIRDQRIKPEKESDVRNAVYGLLLHPYPDTVRDVPIAKVSTTYKPDIGIRSLKAAVEYKFVATEADARRVIGEVFEDVNGYAGSDDWKHFYAVFYMTAAFLTPAQVEAEFSLSNVDKSWKPLLVSGEGRRKPTANKHMQRIAEKAGSR